MDRRNTELAGGKYRFSERHKEVCRNEWLMAVVESFSEF